jgi:hypothetical protein
VSTSSSPTLYNTLQRPERSSIPLHHHKLHHDPSTVKHYPPLHVRIDVHEPQDQDNCQHVSINFIRRFHSLEVNDILRRRPEDEEPKEHNKAKALLTPKSKGRPLRYGSPANSSLRPRTRHRNKDTRLADLPAIPIMRAATTMFPFDF